MRAAASWAVALAVGLAAAPALAEIFVCTGPDGSKRYVSDASQCPGAQKHELTGQVQRAAGASAPQQSRGPLSAIGGQRRSARPAAASAADDEAAARSWREKRLTAEQQLAQVEVEISQAEASLRWCNRGGDMYLENTETGLRRGLPCSEVEQSYGRLKIQHRQLQQYLDEGLEEECRRSGCLPGWVR